MNRETKSASTSELKQLYGFGLATGALWGAISLYKRWLATQDTLARFRLESALQWFTATATHQEIQQAALICETLCLGTLFVALLSHGIEHVERRRQ